MFTVEGYIGMVSYAVQVGGDLDGATTADSAGIVRGSVRAISHLLLHVGDQVAVTPTGPTVTGSTTDPAAVLGVLIGTTQVTRVHGDDVPDLIPAASGAVLH